MGGSRHIQGEGGGRGRNRRERALTGSGGSGLPRGCQFGGRSSTFRAREVRCRAGGSSGEWDAFTKWEFRAIAKAASALRGIVQLGCDRSRRIAAVGEGRRVRVASRPAPTTTGNGLRRAIEPSAELWQLVVRRREGLCVRPRRPRSRASSVRPREAYPRPRSGQRTRCRWTTHRPAEQGGFCRGGTELRRPLLEGEDQGSGPVACFRWRWLRLTSG